MWDSKILKLSIKYVLKGIIFYYLSCGCLTLEVICQTIACVAVFSISFQASGSRTRHVAEVTKKLVAGGRGREGKEKPAAELRHFTQRPNCFRSLGTSTVTSTVTRDPILLHPPTQFIPSLFRHLEKQIYFACIF